MAMGIPPTMYLAEKTTQVAAKFVSMAGGTMPYIVLLKLLYLADRQMLVRWGVPMTYDAWYSMPYGPVLSNTYNAIKKMPVGAGAIGRDYWGRHLCKSRYDLCVVNDPGDDLLSAAEDSIIEEIYQAHGAKNQWELIDFTHELPEWNDPGNSSIPITYESVLIAEGLPRDAVARRIENIQTTREIAAAFAAVK